MTVDRGRALQATRDGRTYHFCSEGCRDAFVGGDAGGHADAAHVAPVEHRS
jgi:hypothetical protein